MKYTRKWIYVKWTFAQSEGNYPSISDKYIIKLYERVCTLQVFQKVETKFRLPPAINITT